MVGCTCLLSFEGVYWRGEQISEISRARTRVLPMPQTRVDWEQVIIQIQRSTWLESASDRMSLLAIGEACGRSFGWAWNLKNIPGTEPRYSDGVLLLRLWSEKTGDKTPPVHQEPERN